TQNKMKVVSVFESCKTYKKNEFLQNTNHLERVFLISSLCSNANINSDGKIVGDSTECALWEFSLENNFNITKTRESFKRISEQPFSSETKKMVTINTLQNGTYAFIKGACDLLLDKCSFLRIDNKIVPMTSKLKSQILTAHSQFTNQAQRVLMLAEKPLCESEEFCEKDLVFVALVGMIDPPRPEVFDAINKCHKAGMKPVMITGDHKETAFAIAKSLNIAKTMNEIITGQELDAISDTELPKHVNKFSVFARVTPEHKSRIVRALKEQGHVVAMTGDGVNDAPSIKQADIGTCMGSGTDVTKSVSDLIITDDNFATIVVAVSEGRTIYNNIQKTIQFLISTNAVEVLGLFVASIIMRDSVFLTASQILFINLITDSLPAFALGIEPAEKNIMQKPPRNSKESIFSGEIGTAIIYQAFVQTLVVLVLFVWAYHTYGNATANTMTFITICLMQILHAINCKTNKSIFSINPFANKFFNISFVALLALILSVSLIPAFQTAFNIIAMSNVQWCIVTLASLSIVPLVEIFKLILKPQKI
ncbi:MAG: cation-translocating P-type ATPase, partial [Clostridia bacterium]|nr:cation-translocating P-type ATPase [Clostridia bacterium]